MASSSSAAASSSSTSASSTALLSSSVNLGNRLDDINFIDLEEKSLFIFFQRTCFAHELLSFRVVCRKWKNVIEKVFALYDKLEVMHVSRYQKVYPPESCDENSKLLLKVLPREAPLLPTMIRSADASTDVVRAPISDTDSANNKPNAFTIDVLKIEQSPKRRPANRAVLRLYFHGYGAYTCAREKSFRIAHLTLYRINHNSLAWLVRLVPNISRLHYRYLYKASQDNFKSDHHYKVAYLVQHFTRLNTLIFDAGSPPMQDLMGIRHLWSALASLPRGQLTCLAFKDMHAAAMPPIIGDPKMTELLYRLRRFELHNFRGDTLGILTLLGPNIEVVYLDQVVINLIEWRRTLLCKDPEWRKNLLRHVQMKKRKMNQTNESTSTTTTKTQDIKDQQQQHVATLATAMKKCTLKSPQKTTTKIKPKSESSLVEKKQSSKQSSLSSTEAMPTKNSKTKKLVMNELKKDASTCTITIQDKSSSTSLSKMSISETGELLSTLKYLDLRRYGVQSQLELLQISSLLPKIFPNLICLNLDMVPYGGNHLPLNKLFTDLTRMSKLTKLTLHTVLPSMMVEFNQTTIDRIPKLRSIRSFTLAFEMSHKYIDQSHQLRFAYSSIDVYLNLLFFAKLPYVFPELRMCYLILDCATPDVVQRVSINEMSKQLKMNFSKLIRWKVMPFATVKSDEVKELLRTVSGDVNNADDNDANDDDNTVTVPVELDSGSIKNHSYSV